jgi:hypothetical protein
MIEQLGKNIYISEQGRKNVLTYKYTPCDDSLISPYLEPFWNWFLVTLTPEWMAPNVVTLIGFVAILIHYFLCIFYMPMLEVTDFILIKKRGFTFFSFYFFLDLLQDGYFLLMLLESFGIKHWTQLTVNKQEELKTVHLLENYLTMDVIV